MKNERGWIGWLCALAVAVGCTLPEPDGLAGERVDGDSEDGGAEGPWFDDVTFDRVRPGDAEEDAVSDHDAPGDQLEGDRMLAEDVVADGAEVAVDAGGDTSDDGALDAPWDSAGVPEAATEAGADVAPDRDAALPDVVTDATAGCGPRTLCGVACVDLQADPGHCGACGRSCVAGANATSRCARGSCEVTCLPGFGNCDGGAANGCETPLNGNANCGACGRACPVPSNATATCAMSACGITCTGSFANCDLSTSNGCEVDLNASASNCGACGRACALTNASSSCVGGSCAVTTCNLGFGNCDGAPANGCEIDTRTNGSHCGACGRACTAGQTCTSGACACPARLTNCGGACVDLQSDRVHCGACGVSCHPHATCSGGACVLDCVRRGGYERDCDGDPANGCETSVYFGNPNHCGTCGNACPAGVSCNFAQCGCSGGRSRCSGVCVDTTTDPRNCGACGRACLAGQVCVSGVCGTECSGTLCTGGLLCQVGACVATCAVGRQRCGGHCVDLRTDLQNCGACGTVCDYWCASGRCHVEPPCNPICP